MIYDTVTIQRLRALPVFSVASHLGMTLYGTGQTCRRCLCPLHDDHHPSLHLNAPRNIFKCFSCGKGGDVISITCFFNPRREKSNRNRFTVYRLG